MPKRNLAALAYSRTYRRKRPLQSDDLPTAGYSSELLTLEFDEEITDQDSLLSMVGAASKRHPASE